MGQDYPAYLVSLAGQLHPLVLVLYFVNPAYLDYLVARLLRLALKNPEFLVFPDFLAGQ